jgi:hypothetical protein
MPPDFVGDLTHGVAASHLAPYLWSSREDEVLAVALFDWNLRLAGAFLEDLAIVEVLLRGAIDEKMRNQFEIAGKTGPWYEQDIFMYDHREPLDRAIKQAHDDARDHEPDHDEVVAAMSFGVWAMLLREVYQKRFWPYIRDAFAHLPPTWPKLKRDFVETRVVDLRDLRNDIAHHRPIIDHDLATSLQGIKTLSGLISPEIQWWLSRRSRVPEVLGADPRKTRL